MQTTKKLVLIVLVLGTVFATVFAQTSMTALSTQSLFTTDVDDFMDVNEWHNLFTPPPPPSSPRKLFAFLGYNTLDTSGAGNHKLGDGQLNLGFAKQLTKVYIGAYFEGLPILWDSKTEKDNNGNKKVTVKTLGTESTYASVLTGFKNIGIKGAFYFKPVKENFDGIPGDEENQHITDEAAKKTTISNVFDMAIGVTAGMNINGPKDRLYKTSASIALVSAVRKLSKSDDTANTASMIDKSVYTLKINGGAGFDFWQKRDITQSLALALDTDWDIFPKKTRYDKSAETTENTVGRLNDAFTLTPVWTLAYEPEGKFAFKAEADMPVKFHFENDYNYTESVTSASTTTTYNTSREYKFNLGFEPTLKGAVTWKPFSKLRFNAGASFTVPKFGWNTKKTETRAADGTVTNTTKEVTWSFSNPAGGTSGDFSATSGLTWFVTDKVTVDGNWNIAKNFFYNTGTNKWEFKTQLSENNYNFWNTVNKLLIHNVSFLVSFKL